MTSTTDNDERRPVSSKPEATRDEQEVRRNVDAPSSQKEAAVPAQRRAESSRSESVTEAVDAEKTDREKPATEEGDAGNADVQEAKALPERAVTDVPAAREADATSADTSASGTPADAASASATPTGADTTPADAPDAPEADADTGTHDEGGRQPLSPSQARRIRMRVAGAFMAIAAVVLVVRLSDQPSVLVMGVYGAALILCGVVIELSRRGRTRLGMWMLAGGLVAVALADQWLRSV